MPLKVAKLAGYIYQNLEIDANGAARVVLPQSILNSYDIVDSETAAIVSMPGKLKMFSHGQSLLNSRKVIIAFGYVPKDQSLIQLLKTSWRRPSLASGANARDAAEIEVIYQEIQAACQEWAQNK